jgi:hypothetical protein
MKFALGLFILSVTLFTISNNSAVASHDTRSTASAVESAGELPDRPQSDIEPMTYPHCSVYQGQPCQPGWVRKCMLAPFEPARCHCTTSLVYECA